LKSRPPALATWLFESLTRREHREALAGDLLEEYNQRQSETWYWRQVLAAVVANFRTELRSRWVSVVFALVVCGVFPWAQLFLNKEFQSLHRNTTEVARFTSDWHSNYFSVSECDSNRGAEYLCFGCQLFSPSPFSDRFVLRHPDSRVGQRGGYDLASATVVPPIFLLRGLATAVVLQSCCFDVGGVWTLKASWRFTSRTLNSVYLRTMIGATG
jgi:hypothetical protein